MGGLNVNRNLFRKSGFTGLVAVFAMIGILVWSTTTYGISLNMGGLPMNLPQFYKGGYMVEYSHIDSEGTMMSPVWQDVNSVDGIDLKKKLMIRLNVDHLTLYDLHITKVINVGSALRAATGDKYDACKLCIIAGTAGRPVEITNLIMDIDSMKTKMAKVGLFEEDYQGNMKMMSMVMDDVHMNTHYQQMDAASFPDFTLRVELCNSDDKLELVDFD